MKLLLLAILPLLAVLGFILLVLGLRGKRINDHPVCRKCRFDLFGNPETSSCPECGRDLKPKRAVRIGVRRKRRGMIVTATLLLLLSFGGGGTAGYFAVTGAGVNWQEVKPVWWLQREAGGPPGPGSTSDAALDELVRRHGNQSLSASQLQSLIDDALLHQADLKRPWQPQWGDIVEQAHRDGDLGDEAWQQYAENVIGSYAELILRPQVRIGDPIPYRIKDLPARVGKSTHFWARESGDAMMVGGIKVRTSFGSGSTVNANSGGYSSSSVKLTSAQYDQLVPGPVDIEIVLNLAILEYADGSPADDSIADKVIRLRSTCELLPGDQPTAAIMSEAEMTEKLDAEVRAAIKLERVRSHQYDWERERQQITLDPEFDIDMRPADVAFDVIARQDGIEHKLSSISVPAGNETGYHTSGTVPKAWEGKPVDIILRPSVGAALGSVDCFKIWGREIVFENVTVEPRKKNR